MRVDPHGVLVRPEVPDELLQRWSADRAAHQAELAAVTERHAAEVEALNARIGRLRGLAMDAGMVGHDLIGLAYLFDKALVDDGPATELNTASHIVVDCIRSMAARLEALETHAGAAYLTGDPS